MTSGEPAAGELTQWLQALDPHRSLAGEYDSTYFCAGAPPWKQAGFIALGDNVAWVQEPDRDRLDEDRLGEAEAGFWRLQEWKPGILTPQRWACSRALFV